MLNRWFPALAALALLTVATPAHATPGQPEVSADPSNAWSAELRAVGGDDVNVAWTGAALRLADPSTAPGGQRAPVAQGMLLTAAHTLATPANLVTAAVTGSADVEYRGRSGDR